MILTISTTHQPATDLGYLLHKHPDQVQSFPQTFGTAHVFYPEATAERCTAALMIDVDPVGLVRDRKSSGFALDQYVNDRPYVASSFLSVAIANVFGTALAGRCKNRPELAATPIPLRAEIAALPCRSGEATLINLFAPLGYTTTATPHVLDSAFPEWGQSRYFTVTLEATCTLSDLLSHLYVLIPVLDDDKHYWIGDDEVEKLMRHGEGWLQTHPERAFITRRYLRNRGNLVGDALRQLTAADPIPEPDETAALVDEKAEKTLSLHTQRIMAVATAIRAAGARRVVDLGCGEGRLLRELLRDHAITELVGMDVSHRELEKAKERLERERAIDALKSRVTLWQGSLMYRDARLAGFDAAACVEVIEHLDPPRLAAFERVIFEFARPNLMVITTPNADYNVLFETLTAGTFRHHDHRFEWTRAEFAAWAGRVAATYGYGVLFTELGPIEPAVGAPSQMATFTRNAQVTA